MRSEYKKSSIQSKLLSTMTFEVILYTLKYCTYRIHPIPAHKALIVSVQILLLSDSLMPNSIFIVNPS